MTSDLTVEELEAFAKQIESQYKDGWGADFELQNIATSCSTVVCLRLFHDGLTFYTGNEFKEVIMQEMNYQETEKNSPSLCN